MCLTLTQWLSHPKLILVTLTHIVKGSTHGRPYCSLLIHFLWDLHSQATIFCPPPAKWLMKSVHVKFSALTHKFAQRHYTRQLIKVFLLFLTLVIINNIYLQFLEGITEYIHGWRARLLVAVSYVSSGLHVGLITEAFVNHLTVNFPSASISQILLP